MKKGNKLINIPLAPFRKGEQKLKAPSRRGLGGCSAFTLVELIVTITILAILGTIGFMSFQSYTVYSRDVTRQSELSLINRAIKIKQAEGGYAPMPENAKEITASGEVIGYEGEFTKKIGNKYGISGKLEDPLDGSNYVYSVDKNLDVFTLGAFMEGDEIALNNLGHPQGEPLQNILDNSYAKEGRKLSVKGDKFGIILKNGEAITGAVDIVKTEDIYEIYFDNNEKIEGTGSTLVAMIPNISCKRILELGNKKKIDGGNGVYTINPEGDNPFRVYCDMVTNGGGWTLIASLDDSGQGRTDWLDSKKDIGNLSKISDIKDTSVSNKILQNIKPREFRWHPAKGNNINLKHYFYLKPDYDLDYTKLFKAYNPDPGENTERYTWYWTVDGGLTKWIGRTNLEKNFLMFHRDGTNCNGGPCGVFDFDIDAEKDGSNDIAHWDRVGERWDSYIGTMVMKKNFRCLQSTDDENYNINFGDYNGKLCENSEKLTDFYEKGAVGLGIFVR